MKHLKCHYHLLHVLRSATPNLRKAILNEVSDEVIKAITECVFNVLYGNHSIGDKTKYRLSSYKDCLRQIAERNTTLAKKRKIIIQNGGFLPILLRSILRALAPLIQRKESASQ